MKKKIIYISIFLIICAIILFNPKERKYTIVVFKMDTIYNIHLWTTYKNFLFLKTKIKQKLTNQELLYSTHISNSEASKINLPIKKIELDKKIISLLKLSREIYNKTEKKFDITIYPVIEAYGFYSKNYKIPTKEDINYFKKIIGFSKIQIYSNYITKNSINVKADLGGIAKGRIVDELAELVKINGIDKYIIEGGGDIRLGKRYKKNIPYSIGIRNPRSGSGTNTVSKIFYLENCSIVTSGDYERYFFSNNIRYHHIIDPETLLPAGTCQSVTVIASNTALADGLSTAFFILGENWWIENSNKFPDVRAFFINSSHHQQ